MVLIAIANRALVQSLTFGISSFSWILSKTGLVHRQSRLLYDCVPKFCERVGTTIPECLSEFLHVQPTERLRRRSEASERWLRSGVRGRQATMAAENWFRGQSHLVGMHRRALLLFQNCSSRLVNASCRSFCVLSLPSRVPTPATNPPRGCWRESRWIDHSRHLYGQKYSENFLKTAEKIGAIKSCDLSVPDGLDEVFFINYILAGPRGIIRILNKSAGFGPR